MVERLGWGSPAWLSLCSEDGVGCCLRLMMSLGGVALDGERLSVVRVKVILICCPVAGLFDSVPPRAPLAPRCQGSSTLALPFRISL